MKREAWKRTLEAMPTGLTLIELSNRIGKSYRLTASWVKELGYQYSPGHQIRWTAQKRREFQRAPWDRIPWGCTNAQIARAYGVSREIVRRRRKQLNNRENL